MKSLIKYLWTIVLFGILSCQTNDNPLEQVIAEDSDLSIIANDPQFEVQILYTQVDRDESQNPKFTTYSFGVDSNRYFYPASTVKFPASLLALEKINELGVENLDKWTRMITDSAYSRQSRVLNDSTSPDASPSIGHYIRKILITSDNDAFNRLYEFLGQDDLNGSLRSKAYDDARIIHRLSIGRTPDENLHTNPIRFYQGDSLVYQQQLVKSSGNYLIEDQILKGVGFMSGGELVNAPMDFTNKNFFPLDEQHRMMKSVMFPEYFDESVFDLTAKDYEFLYRNMALLPTESGIDAYENDPEHFYEAYCKFLMFGSDPGEDIPDHIRIFDKIGLAYGYCIDNAYIVDFENNIEFFLSAVIHTNANQVFNDGQYEYDAIAFPFMKKLGWAVHQLELDRQRQNQPDLTTLKKLFE
ncbi:MAG: serine hydrolase [Cyclobacteriaceae bacterium]